MIGSVLQEGSKQKAGHTGEMSCIYDLGYKWRCFYLHMHTEICFHCFWYN